MGVTLDVTAPIDKRLFGEFVCGVFRQMMG